jgi:hypothetical protein
VKQLVNPSHGGGYQTILPLPDIHPADTAMQQADVLEEIQVALGLLGVVVCLEYTIDAFRCVHIAEKRARLEINPDVQLTSHRFKTHPVDQPEFLYAQCLLEELFCSEHNRRFYALKICYSHELKKIH